jgi:RNA polymerase sigma-70 factor, ECF subfamily
MSTVDPTRPGVETLDQRVADARIGSRQALGDLFAACRDYLLVVANRELPGDVRAKCAPSDVVQETLLAAQQQFGQFEGRGEAELLAWLRQILLGKLADADRKFRRTGKREIARELALDGLDSAAWQGPGLASDPTESPSRVAMAHETQEAIALAIATLPPEYQQVILLRCQQRHSFAEVGVALGRTDDGARKLWFRAIRRLKHECRRLRQAH